MAVANRVMGGLPALGVRVRELPHERRELSVGVRPEDEMPVVGHDAPAEDANWRQGVGLDQHALERQEVLWLFEEPQAAVGTVEHVIDQSAGGIACLARHAGRIPASNDMFNYRSRPV
jgi:hypothetical protein